MQAHIVHIIVVQDFKVWRASRVAGMDSKILANAQILEDIL